MSVRIEVRISDDANGSSSLTYSRTVPHPLLEIDIASQLLQRLAMDIEKFVGSEKGRV